MRQFDGSKQREMTQLPVEEPRPFGEDISVLMLLSSGPKRQLIQAARFLVQLFPEGGAGTAARLGVSDPLCWNPGPSPTHVEDLDKVIPSLSLR